MSIIAQLKEKVTQYVDVYVKLFKLDFIGRTANLLSYFIFTMIAMFIAFSMLMFLGFALVEVYMNLGATKMASFFLVIGTFFAMLLILAGLRRPITRFFATAVIKVLTDGDDEEDKEKQKEEDNE